MEKYIDLANNINNCMIRFPLVHDFWDDFNDDLKTFINGKEWGEFKYIINGHLSDKIRDVPRDKGGIYCFYIHSNILKNHSFLIYVGRAHCPSGNNLRDRIKSYYKNAYIRPKLGKMFEEWGEYIYCRYMPLDILDNLGNKSGDALINEIEAELINKLLPPANSEIPDIKISKALKVAFI